MCAHKRPECEEAPVGMTCGGRPVRPDEILKAKRSAGLSPADLSVADGVGTEEDEDLEEDGGFDEDEDDDEDEEEDSAAERMLRIASDAVEEVRWRRREAKRKLPERASVAWFDRLLTEGTPEEKLAAICLVFAAPWCAEHVEEFILDPDPRVSEAYASRTVDLVVAARALCRAAERIAPDDIMKDSDTELLRAWLDMTHQKGGFYEEDEAYETEMSDVAEEARRWRDAVRALNLMQDGLSWLDCGCWKTH